MAETFSFEEAIGEAPKAKPAATFSFEEAAGLPTEPRRGTMRTGPAPYVPADEGMRPGEAGQGRGFVNPGDEGRRAFTPTQVGRDLAGGVEQVKALGTGATAFGAGASWRQFDQAMADMDAIDQTGQPLPRKPDAMGAAQIHPYAQSYALSDPATRQQIRAKVEEGLRRDESFIADSVKAIQAFNAKQQELSGDIPQFTDVLANKAGFVEWAVRNGVATSPTMAASMLGALAGVPGLAATSGAMALGDMTSARAEHAVKAGMTPAQTARHIAENTGTTAALAVPYAALDFIGPAGTLATGGAKGLASQGLRGIATQGAKEVGKEAFNEGGQEVINIGSDMAAGERPTEVTGEDAKRVLNAAAVGGLMGGGGHAANVGGDAVRAKVRADMEMRALKKAAEAGDVEAAVELYALERKNMRPSERRRETLNRFDDLRAQYGLLDPTWEKAAEAAKAKTATMPLDQVPGFLRRFTASFASKTGRQLDETALASLDEPELSQGGIETPPVKESGQSGSHETTEAGPAPDIADRLAGQFGIADEEPSNAQPDLAASPPVAAGAGAAGAPDADAGGGTVGSVAPDATGQGDGRTAAPELGDRGPVAAEGGDAADQALTPLDQRAHEAATSPLNDIPEPTDAQKAAGNYKVGRVRISGMDVSIENPVGSVRSSKAGDSNPWSVVMPAHYGYIRGTEGSDGDHVDLFIGPREDNGRFWIINQTQPDAGTHDEHKVITGVDSADEAVGLYKASFADNFGEKVFGSVSAEFNADQLKARLPAMKKARPVLRPAGTPTMPTGRVPAGATSPSEVSPPVVGAQAAPPAPSMPIASWVIREKATGKVIAETFDRRKVDALNTAKYEAVPIQEHLASLNRKNAEQPPAQPVAESQAPGRSADGDGGVAPAQAAGGRILTRAGRTPNSTTPIELRQNADGTLTPYMDDKEMLDYESGDPIKMAAGISDLDAKKAIRAAGAVSSKVNFYSADRAPKAEAKPPAPPAPPPAKSAAAAPEPPKPDQRAARARAPMALDPERDTMLQALAKLGGIQREVVAREFGLKPEELKHTVNIGGLKGFAFRKTGGMGLDAAMTALREAGYFAGVADEDIRTKFEEAIYNELGGGRELTPQGTIRAAEDARAAEEMDLGAVDDFTPDELEESGYADLSPEVKAATQMLLADAERAGLDTETIKDDAARATQDQTDDDYHARLQAALREALQAGTQDDQGTPGADTGAARGSDQGDGSAAGDQGGEEEGAQGLMRGSEEDARARGFTLKAYRGVSAAKPFNDTDSTWLTTSREVAEAYAEEVMGYDDPAVLTVMVKPDALPRHDASRLTEEQREQLGADQFGNPQAVGIYDLSDDHSLGGSRRNVTVIHAPKTAVFLVDADSRPDLTLTAPTREKVLAQQAAIEREQADREAPADKPESKLTGEQVDAFNTQGSVFDQPAEAAAPSPAAEKPKAERPAAKGPATAQAAIDAFNADDSAQAMAIVAKLKLDDLKTVGGAIGYPVNFTETATAYRQRLAGVADRLTKTSREQVARERVLFDKLTNRASDFDRMKEHMERAERLGNAPDSTAFDTAYYPMDGGDSKWMKIPEALKLLAADVRSLKENPDYPKVSEMVRKARPAVFDAADAAPADAPQPQPEKAEKPATDKESLTVPMPAVLGIPREAAQAAHAGTSFVPEQRAMQEQDGFMSALRDAWTRAARIAGTDEKAIERITEVFKDVADGYRQRYLATLGARSRVMSSMIAGPARFPVERNRKRMETEMKRAEEAQQYLDRGIKRLIRAARGPIDNSPESELERVRLNLSQREEQQETMKAANVALRKGDDAALEDLGFTAEQIADLKKPDFAGRKGFPDYKLTNNNAEIRRLRERLKDAESRMEAAAAGPAEREVAGVRVVEDATADRIRLYFDGKPSEEVLDTLKSNGFRWSPKEGAWQRQLTDNARRAADDVLAKMPPGDLNLSAAEPDLAAPFYSELSRQVERVSMNAGPAASWKAWLRGLPQKGVKPDEIAWTGIEEWLDIQQGKVTKQSVLGYLNANGVKVTETTLGVKYGPGELDSLLDQWAARNQGPTADAINSGETWNRTAAIAERNGDDEVVRMIRRDDESANFGPDTHPALTLPGATNYREVLLTLPSQRDALIAHRTAMEKRGALLQGNPNYAQDRAEYDARQAQIVATQDYKSGHWDQLNVLAHIRLNDRTDADGKRVLFVEEIQSDYAQAARKGRNDRIKTIMKNEGITKQEAEKRVPEDAGFIGSMIPQNRQWKAVDTLEEGIETRSQAEAKMRELEPFLAKHAEPGVEDRLAIIERDDGFVVVQESRSAVAFAPAKMGVPRAPFVGKTDAWVALALKRVIKMAAAEGYDRVAFVTGEQSAERYDLSKQVRSIAWSGRGNDTEKRVTIAPNSGNDIEFIAQPDGRVGGMAGGSIGNEFDGKRLDEIVGKEVAERILGETHGDMRGNGLKVGGEGMKAFYDKIVPSVLRDVLRKVGGGQIGEVQIAKHEGIKFGDGSNAMLAQPGFDITPAMREKAFGGLPLFQADNPAGWSSIDGGGSEADTARYAADPDRNHLRIVDFARESIAERRPGFMLRAVEAPGSRSDLRAARAVARGIAGHKVIFVKQDNGRAFNGAAFESPGHDYLLIDVDSSEPVMAVTGHEMLHRLRSARPDLYEALDKRIRRILQNESDYAKQLRDRYERLQLKPLSEDKIHEELIADIFGDEWSDPEFWRELGKDQPNGLRAIVDAVVKFLDDMIAKVVKTRPFGTETYLTNLREARDAVLEATREFSKGEVGNLDTVPSDLQFSTPAGPPTPTAETVPRAIQRKLQDQFNRFTVVREWAKDQGIPLSADSNVWAYEERMHGRIATRVQDFREKTIEPKIKAIQKAGFTMAQVAEYLHAQHAEERNKQIESIDPTNQSGSGMTTADAQAILAKAPVTLAALANDFRKITDATKAILLNAGIINKDMTDAWEATYQNYVPLKGGPDEKAAQTGTGKGLTVAGKQKRALGHSERSEFIIENILRDHERAIALAEKNTVGHSLLAFISELGNPEVATIGKPEKRKVLKNSTDYEVKDGNGQRVAIFDSLDGANQFLGQHALFGGRIQGPLSIEKVAGDPVVSFMAAPMMAPNEVTVYLKGHAIRVQLNDPLLARAYTRAGTEHLNQLMAMNREINALFSKVYTGYNPEFLLTNMARDWTTGLINVTGQYGGGISTKAAANYPKAFAQMLRYSMTGKSTPDIDAYRASGGSTGAAYLSDLERIGRDVEVAYDEYRGVVETAKAKGGVAAGRAAARKFVGHLLGWLEHLNAAGENAMRLAVFEAVSNTKGFTVNDAASAAKNSTVNFNRRGEWGPVLGAMYLFFNPAIQGTAAMADALVNGKHKAQAMALVAALPALAYLLAASQFGGGDDDDEAWDAIPSSDKDKSIVIRTGPKTRITIPIPYGYAFFYSLGNAVFDLVKGRDKAKVSLRVASNLLEHFSPIGNPLEGDKPDVRGLVEMIPGAIGGELARHGIRVAANRNSFGGDIVPDSPFDSQKPDVQRLYRSTKGTLYDKAAQAMSSATGGTKSLKGGIDVSPETLKYWTRAITGGSGAFVADTFGLAGLAARYVHDPKDENAPALMPERSELPILRRFAKEERVADRRRLFWDSVEQIKAAQADLQRARKLGDETGEQKVWDKRGELIAMGGYMGALTKMVKAQRDLVDEVMADESTTLAYKRARVKVLEDEESKMYGEFVREFATERKRADAERKKAAN